MKGAENRQFLFQQNLSSVSHLHNVAMESRVLGPGLEIPGDLGHGA